MSQRDNFSGGFLLGVIVGSLAGGLVGSLIASRRLEDETSAEGALSDANLPEAKPVKGKSRSLQSTSEKSIEVARRSLEDKIAQLNEAIDDVRQQLGNVNGNRIEHSAERSLTKES